MLERIKIGTVLSFPDDKYTTISRLFMENLCICRAVSFLLVSKSTEQIACAECISSKQCSLSSNTIASIRKQASRHICKENVSYLKV